jgi:membrane fusion protein (multidrug efflux system)
MPQHRIVLTTSLLAALSALLVGCGARPSAESAASSLPTVEVAPVAQENVQLHSEWVATLDGSVNAQIQPQVTGYLIKQDYREGAFVRKGQVLFEIDPRPMQAALDQARAQKAQAESQVAQAQSAVMQVDSELAQAAAQLRKAELDVKRDQPLVAAHAVSQGQLETEQQALVAAEANVRATKARAASSRAAVKAAEAAVAAAAANVSQAELNLGFTKVHSLIDGVAGVAQTQIGNLVKPETVLTSVSQVNPIRAYFPISEREYLDLAGATNGKSKSGLLQSTTASSLELVLTNGAVYPHKGRVAFADRQVDAQTGTLRMAAEFPNPGNILRPGQFGRIRTASANGRDALLIPQRAVTDVQGKYQVAVVDTGNKVHIRPVTLGLAVGSRFIVEQGLRAGERVVVEGVAKAADGAAVAVKPAATPAQQ